MGVPNVNSLYMRYKHLVDRLVPGLFKFSRKRYKTCRSESSGDQAFVNRLNKCRLRD